MKGMTRRLLSAAVTVLACGAGAVGIVEASSSAHGATPPAHVSPTELRLAAQWFAEHSGDARPDSTSAVETTGGDASSDVGGSASGTDPHICSEDVYEVTMRGRFTGYLAHVPPHVPLPTGTSLTLVVDAFSGQVVMWTLASHPPNLTHYGAKVERIG